MNATNTLSEPSEQQKQRVSPPVVETVEKYRSEIMNTILSGNNDASTNTRSASQRTEKFINMLSSLLGEVSNDTTFERLLQQVSSASQNPITTLNSALTDIRTFVGSQQANQSLFLDVQQREDVQFIITALAHYRRHQAQERLNDFYAQNIGQENQTDSSAIQQIEAAAQRARLGKPTLYRRNKKPLRIEWDATAGSFIAQYLDRNGQVGTLTGIQDAATLVGRIDTDSQPVKGLLSDNVQENVEVRESKKADHRQIMAAIDFVNRGMGQDEREKRTGFYSIDNRNIAIRGEGVGEFSVDVIQPDGSIVTRNGVAQNTITQMIDAACAAYEKSKERKETVEAVDMGNQFSESIFRKLCRDISSSKDKVAEYTLSGQKYTVREVTEKNTSANPPIPAALYWAQFPNPQGRTNTYPAAGQPGETIENITAHIAQNTRTSTNAGNCTRDMGNEFSANTFRELCEEIAEAKNGRGTYTLAGKKYEVRVDQPLPVDIQQAQFHVEYPNNFGVKAHADGTLDTLLDVASHGPLSHVHVHDPSKPHPFQKETMIELCREADNTGERQEFDFHGKSCFVYKPTGLDRAKGRYCVDIPNNKGGVDTIKAIWPKGLYDKFIEHTHKLHHEAEHGNKGAEHPAEGGHKDAGHGDHAHKEEHGKDHGGHESHGFFDTAVHKIAGLFHSLGNGIIWGKNQVPEGIRKFGGATVDTAWKSAVTGGLVVGGTALLPGVTFAAAAAGFWPVTLASGAVIGGRKLYKWWKGGDEGGGHGGHH